jgi:hypothetical protein
LATGCGTTPTLHQIGTPLSGTTYYVKAGASCISVPVPTGVALYYIGSEIPSSSFVAATEQTGP